MINSEGLQRELDDVLIKVKNKELNAKEANAITNTSNTKIRTALGEISYDKWLNKKRTRPFFEPS